MLQGRKKKTDNNVTNPNSKVDHFPDLVLPIDVSFYS